MDLAGSSTECRRPSGCDCTRACALHAKLQDVGADSGAGRRLHLRDGALEDLARRGRPGHGH
eukprot:15702723-Heterocapsa_arctica.AAC.1